jgi:molybdopterin converting factor small subunit
VTTVKVRTIGQLKALLGRGEFDVAVPDGATVGDVLALLAEKYGRTVAQHLEAPAAAGAHPPLRVTVNGRDIAVLDDRDTVLQDGDDLLILTPIAGG